VKLLLASTLDRIIGGANGGGGGVLAQGIHDARYNLDVGNLTDFAEVLGRVLL